MKKIALMDTSILSFNIGDQIIMESARCALEPILRDAFVVRMPTHSPLFHTYEFSLRRQDSFRQNLNDFDWKFVCGTNLLEKNMKKRKNTWNIHKSDLKYFRDYILVGVGTDGLPELMNRYTEKLYRQALSSEYIHSTRDEQTKRLLEEMGFRAVNTGCMTLWGFTESHCAEIPQDRSDTVVFTVTDYMPDLIKDRQIIALLCEMYEKVYCWIQGGQDYRYLKELGLDVYEKKIKYITPSLEQYDRFLDNHKCDYVGTRLHAGIRAMQKKKRAIIIGVDNRAYDMTRDYHLNYIDRKNIETLEEKIAASFATSVKIDERKIGKFLGQFQTNGQ